MKKRMLGSVLMLSFSISLAAQSNAVQNKADIDPAAMTALDKMGSYLRTINAFQVKAVQTSDDVMDNGQTFQSSREINMVAVKPNRLHVEITSDERDVLLFFNGKNFTIYGSLVNYYATVPAPPTIRELIGALDEKYGIDMPLVDLFLWGSPESNSAQQITSAIDIGPGSVDGTSCEQYAFRQDGLDWQIWIQQGEYPLPRKLILITTDDQAQPRFSEVLTWNLAPSFDDWAFTFDPPADAHKITIAEVAAMSGNDKNSDQGGVK
jgi:hypothetical protein